LRELSLHLLDIFENSLRAGATHIRFTILLDDPQEVLVLRVEDDGPGLPVRPDQALNPFYTTKQGKRTGLGLSLFKAAAQQAGGDLNIDVSDLGGVQVEAKFQHNHLDRTPLGDIAGSIMTILLSNPDLIFTGHICGPEGKFILKSDDFPETHPTLSPFARVRCFTASIKNALEKAGITD
jgi:signal transduction histidine kinase